MEQDVLETLRDLGAAFLPMLRGVFKEDGRVYLVLVSVSLSEIMCPLIDIPSRIICGLEA